MRHQAEQEQYVNSKFHILQMAEQFLVYALKWTASKN